MPIFRCFSCGCMENTAVSSYRRQLMERDRAGGPDPRCSACYPPIGKWHGMFERKPATGMLLDQHGHAWSPGEVEAGRLPPHRRIVATAE